MAIRIISGLALALLGAVLSNDLLLVSGRASAVLEMIFSIPASASGAAAVEPYLTALGRLRLVADVSFGVLLLFLARRFWRDRQRMQRVLLGSESRTTSIFEAAVDAIIIIDSRGTILAVNPATEKTFGYSADEMIQRNINMLMPEPYHSAHDGYLSNYLRTGQKKIIGIGREAVCVRKDQSQFPAYLSVSEMHQDGQRFFTGILHDITELKIAERKLSIERNFISAVLETAGAAVVVLDRNGRIVSFNRASQEISGYTFEEVRGRVIWDFLIPREAAAEVRKQFNSLVLGRFSNHYENSWLTKNGKERLIQWSNTVLEGALDSESEDGRAAFVVGTGIDITEKRRSEKELRVLSRKIIEIQEEERNRIAGEIHDVLGQSLIALKFMVDDALYHLSKKGADVDGKLKDINSYINQAVQQARDISHHLSPIALKKIGLSHAIRELVNSFKTGTNYKIQLDLSDMDVFFRSRWEINVYRIVQESLTNIFKHAAATEIEISARQIGNSLILKIKDNGVGFERQQDTPDSASDLQARGIGQLIMQERAHLLGGHIKILSKKNQGTEILLEIPEQ